MNNEATDNASSFGRIFVRPNGAYSVEFRFASVSGETSTTYLGFEEFRAPRKLMSTLRSKGYNGPDMTADDVALLESALLDHAESKEGQEQTVRLSAVGGWSDDLAEFTMGSLKVHSGEQLPQLPGFESTVSTQQGLPEGWLEGVGRLARCSSFMMLAIAAGLAAPTLRIIGHGPGGFGFNLIGKTTTGKSTAVRAAASLLSNNFAATWDSTPAGLQAKAREFNDLVLTVDSAESVTSGERTVMTDLMAHLLTSGMARNRSKEWEVEHAVVKSEFRTVTLSTEEFDGSLLRRRESGAALRLIDIPVPANEGTSYGIVDRFPRGLPSTSKRSFAERRVQEINRAIDRCYGTAMPAFVNLLIRHREKAVERLAIHKARFLDAPVFAGLSSQQRRMLEAFAFCFAAGCVAIEGKILPWTQKEFGVAMVRCAKCAIGGTADKSELDRVNARRVLAWVADTARSWARYSPNLTCVEVAELDYLLVERGRQAWCYVSGMALHRALGLRKSEITGAMTYLRTQNRLVVEKRPDVLTTQLALADGHPRFFVINPWSNN